MVRPDVHGKTRRSSNVRHVDDVTSSNSTLNAFLGGRRRSWMSESLTERPSNHSKGADATKPNSQTPTSSLRTGPDNPKPVATRRAECLLRTVPETESSPSSTYPLPLSPVATVTTEPSCQHRDSSSPKVPHSQCQTSPKSGPPHALQTTVLPSPEPSNGSTTRPVSEIGMDGDGRRSSVQGTSSPHQAPSPRPNPGGNASVNTTTTVTEAVATSQRTSAPIGLGETSEHSSFADMHRDKRRRVGATGPNPQPTNPPSGPLPGSTTTRNFSDSAATMNNPSIQQGSFSPSVWSGRNFIRLLDFIKPRQDNMEGPRWRLLKSACEAEDWFYLALHQIYCLSSVAYHTCLRIVGFGPPQARGLEFLSLMLVPNADLSREFLAKLAEFPASIDKLVHYQPLYPKVVRQVISFLGHMAVHWTTFENGLKARQYPPLVDELVAQFGITSRTLREVIFIACCCRLGLHYGGAAWMHGYQRIFNKNESLYQERLSRNGSNNPVPVAEMQHQNRWLIESYLLKWKQQQQQRQAAAGNWAGPATPLTSSSQIGPPRAPVILPSSNVPPTLPVQAQMVPVVSQHSPHPHLVPRPSHFIGQNVVVTTGLSNSLQHGQSVSPMAPPNTLAPTVGALSVLPSNTVYNASNQRLVAQQMPTSRPLPIPQPQQYMYTPRRGAFTPQGPTGHSQQGTLHQQEQKFTPLLPLPKSTPTELANPNPLVVGLHQAHLRQVIKFLDSSGTSTDSIHLFQYLQTFAIPPFSIDPSVPLIQWKFPLPPEDFQRLPVKLPSAPHEKDVWGIRDGSRIYQLRCIKVPMAGMKIPEHIWAAADTAWPTAIYIHVNGVEHFVRRKMHNGKDLPLNITGSLKEGPNQVMVTCLHNPIANQKVPYAVALEILDNAEHPRALKSIKTIPMAESLSQIKTKLSGSSTNDDELSVVDPHMTIDLVDPFTARIFEVPARGRLCAHRECFDLETFFSTRLSKVGKNFGMAEEWKCPICGRDARPQSLLIDAFLVDVRSKLGEEKLHDDVRAILVNPDGSWRPKPTIGTSENDTVRRKSTPLRQNTAGAKVETSTPGSASRQGERPDPEVIELD
ncbi:hypothetical protein AJ80_08278 [Polytolypa hystricis UAMH7299]|uniref:SP-RING-type domain-containing protein n=1 Tax=Polytolypa hystricis (strain UAMH7299) TaxID=1447883 RepID=A0A2B7XAC3_POLH7|nr:hypothetical protein AJ80_08278 [Polytolypa hystricis UAMH7299]